MKKTKALYGVSLVLFPILFQYATFIPSITIGDIFFLITLSLMLLSIKPIRLKKSIAVLILYILLQTLFLVISTNLERLTTPLRYIAYLFGIMLLPNLQSSGGPIDRAFNVAGKLSVLLLIVQYFALQIWGLVIPGVLTFLPLTKNSLLGYDDMVNSIGRCMSLFAEPSHFAIYAVLYLFYKLFDNQDISRGSMIWSLITSTAIIMSASFTGVLSMIAVWGLKILQLFKSRKLSIGFVFFIALGLTLLLSIVFSTSAGDYITDQEIYERQSKGRFSGFQYLNEMEFDNISFLFGNGMNDIGEITYLSGWPRLFFYYGLLGSLLYVICIASCFKKKSISVYLIVLIGILMVGTEMNFGSFFMPYMMYVFLFNNKRIV